MEGLWYSDKDTAEAGCWLGGWGEGEERVERSGEGTSFGERDWYEETPSGEKYYFFVLIVN